MPISHSASNRPAPLLVSELRERCMDSVDIATLLLQKFEDQIRRDLPDIEKSLVAHDASAMARTAHALKGAAGAVAAPAIREAAAKIELLAKQNSLETMIEAIDSLRAEVERCIAFLPEARQALHRTGPGTGAGEELT